jgi:hypothetical protein
MGEGMSEFTETLTLLTILVQFFIIALLLAPKR